jgi:hypothetical protein
VSIKRIATGLILVCTAGLVMSTTATAEEESQARIDGLVPVKDSPVAMAYVHPEADFSVFKRVAVLDPFVAFRSNWQRDQNRSRSRNVRARDMDRIKTDVAYLFREVFIERLESAGFSVVNDAGDDVLVLRPAIIDLDVSAPDIRTGGRSRTYTTTNGAATLYIELIDSVSGDLLGLAADRQATRRRGGMMTWNNRVTNVVEARHMFGGWADQLVEFLQEEYGVKGEKK